MQKIGSAAVRSTTAEPIFADFTVFWAIFALKTRKSPDLSGRQIRQLICCICPKRCVGVGNLPQKYTNGGTLSRPLPASFRAQSRQAPKAENIYKTSNTTKKHPRCRVVAPAAEGVVHSTYFCSTVAPHLKRTSMRSSHTMMASTSVFMMLPSLSSVASPSCMCCRKSASHILTVAYRASAV